MILNNIEKFEQLWLQNDKHMLIVYKLKSTIEELHNWVTKRKSTCKNMRSFGGLKDIKLICFNCGTKTIKNSAFFPALFARVLQL